jgi:PPOX class probable F420-dependent enzyme
MDATRAARAAARIDRMLRSESVVWLSTVGPDGQPHLVPIWFSWDGETVLIASKPHARKVANLRANPAVMLALGEPDDDFDVGMIEGVAELPSETATELLPAAHLAKYRTQMAAIGLTPEEFLRTYSQVIRVRPTRFLPWHGRTEPASDVRRAPVDRRIAAAIRRVAATAGRSGVAHGAARVGRPQLAFGA